MASANTLVFSCLTMLLAVDGVQEELGSRVNKLLFENLDDITASSIKDEIENTIKNYEPRVKLLTTKVSPNPDSYEFDVIITYEIIGIDAPAQQLSFALQPAR